MKSTEHLLACHPEQSEAESKDPAEVTLKVSRRDPSTTLGMTVFEDFS